MDPIPCRYRCIIHEMGRTAFPRVTGGKRLDKSPWKKPDNGLEIRVLAKSYVNPKVKSRHPEHCQAFRR